MLMRTSMIVLHATVGWGLCGLSMGAGLALFSLNTALVLHAIAAPVFFAGVAWVYFRRFAYTPPGLTALLFTAVVIALDVVIVALLIERSFAMFASVAGTWLPFALIALSTWFVGRVATARPGTSRGA